MARSAANPQRLCPSCGAREPIVADEPIWPMGWHCAACGRAVAVRLDMPMFAPELADTATGFDPSSFDMLASVEAAHFWFVARNELIIGLADRFFPQARRYLEIGCGNGVVLKALASSRSWERLVGSDLHPSGLAHARSRLPKGVEFVQMDARVIPAVDAFDLIGAYDIVEHVPEDEVAMSALRSAISTGGGAIVAVPQHPWLWSRSDEVAHHQRRYRLGELEAKLERSGFEILFSSSFMSVLLPLMAISRLTARAMPRDAEAIVEREFAVSGVFNRALAALLRAEVRLTLAGMRWPLGGSRVVVARAI